jgi:hypothetical protein
MNHIDPATLTAGQRLPPPSTIGWVEVTLGELLNSAHNAAATSSSHTPMSSTSASSTTTTSDNDTDSLAQTNWLWRSLRLPENRRIDQKLVTANTRLLLRCQYAPHLPISSPSSTQSSRSSSPLPSPNLMTTTSSVPLPITSTNTTVVPNNGTVNITTSTPSDDTAATTVARGQLEEARRELARLQAMLQPPS